MSLFKIVRGGHWDSSGRYSLLASYADMHSAVRDLRYVRGEGMSTWRQRGTGRTTLYNWDTANKLFLVRDNYHPEATG